jgi:hypothetical protein
MGRIGVIVAAAAAAAALAVGVAERPASAAPAKETARLRMPNVVGIRMDRATRTLHQRGLRVNEECSGFFGCVIKANWWICTQSPRPGKLVPKYNVVMIYGKRSLSDC